MTDYYSQCEDALKALFLTLTDYFAHDWQVSDDDSSIGRGGDYFIIFSPGKFQEVPRSDDRQAIQVGWEVLFRLRVRFKSIKESKPKFKDVRSDLFNLITAHKRLDYPTKVANGILGSTLMATERMLYWYEDAKQNSPSWIFQDFKVTVLQVVPVG